MTRNTSASRPARASERAGPGRRLGAAALLAAFLAAGAVAAPAVAQDRLPVVIIYQEQLLEKSLAGQEFRRKEEQRTAELVAERKRIDAEFEAEEKRLAALRPAVSREEFSQLAKAFDQKVQAAREAQDQKAAEVAKEFDDNRRAFFEGLQPVLVEVMQTFGAGVMLDGRSVLLADPALDVTGDVISLMDQRFEEEQNSGGGPAAQPRGSGPMDSYPLPGFKVMPRDALPEGEGASETGPVTAPGTPEVPGAGPVPPQ
ncbi:OmpH family outer membrane protein [Oceanicella sp. SM1341]|uniref:OmpH family outer membrane protein n=1 Tax=Oceanicella sp. SM1341 TaxID=1548889 RepID=UPI000E4BCB7E|nr:OmpH family outer membrane protein [Oceanicella sp. SM1341]